MLKQIPAIAGCLPGIELFTGTFCTALTWVLYNYNSQAPALLLYGFPSSSMMFLNLMTLVSDRYHLIAPGYPEFGFSDFPAMDKFDYFLS